MEHFIKEKIGDDNVRLSDISEHGPAYIEQA